MQPLDKHCVHARICNIGGAVIRRHDAVVRALAQIIHRVTGAKTHLEGREAELARIFRGSAGPWASDEDSMLEEGECVCVC